LRGATLRGRYAWDYLVAGVTATASACIGVLPLVARDVRWSELPSGGALRYARGASVGALLAFPLLLAFGGLFASADPVFGNLVTNALHVDFTAVASHTAFIVAGTALAAGYFWGSVVRTTPLFPLAAPPDLAPGIVPVGTALGLPELRFLVSAPLQPRSFLGRAGLV